VGGKTKERASSEIDRGISQKDSLVKKGVQKWRQGGLSSGGERRKKGPPKQQKLDENGKEGAMVGKAELRDVFFSKKANRQKKRSKK